MLYIISCVFSFVLKGFVGPQGNKGDRGESGEKGRDGSSVSLISDEVQIGTL